MLKDKKKLVIAVLALVVVVAGYKFVLAPGGTEANSKVHGQVYVLPKEFLINLADGRYAKLTVAIVLPHDEKIEADGHSTPPEGFGPLPQEGAVRAVVTDETTDLNADDLIDRSGRKRIREHLLKLIRSHTDVKAEDVLFTDVAVQ
jgi:flagellar basal body-associated protein FliL